VTALRVGTRRSPLALAQARLVADALTARGHEVALVEVTTHGDVSTASLVQIGGTGVFVSALRDALVAGEVDIAVHSLKDLPVAEHDDVVVAAVPERADPRDVLVARDGAGLAELPAAARVGTGSPRRAVQLRAARPDLEVVDVRGNVGTRLRLVDDGSVEAVVLALAGLRRLGADDRGQVLDPDVVLPAPGQGALAVECRRDRAELVRLLAGLDDLWARAATTAERTLLATLEAGCSAPVGALAEEGAGASGERVLRLRAAVGGADGVSVRRLSATGAIDDPAGTGRRLAERLLAEGADRVLGARVQ
jgi:hydroxymethylbilane synthase